MNSAVANPRRILIWILALGCALRILHLWSLSFTAFPQIPLYYAQSDMYSFWKWSDSILAGDLLGRDTYHPYPDYMREIAPIEDWYRWWGGKEVFQQAPLYPYLLALLRWILQDSMLWILFFQLILGAFLPWIMFHLVRRMMEERSALVAAAISAMYGPLLFYQGTLLRDWLAALLEPLALLLILKASHESQARHWIVAGASLGLAVLAKERILLFIPLAFLWIFWQHRGAAARYCAQLLVGVLMVLAPLIGRNLSLGVSPLSLSNRAPEFFIEGNAADAFPIGLSVPDSMAGILKRSDGKFSAVFWETLKTYKGDWSRFFQIQFLKLRGIFDPLEVPNNLNFYYGLEISRALRFTLRYGFLFPLAAAGFILCLSIWRNHLLLLLYGTVVVTGLMLSNISSRQRLVFIPVLTVYAAVAIIRLWDLIRAGYARKAIILSALILAFVLLQQFIIPIASLRSNLTYAVHPSEYLISAYVYTRTSDYDLAVAEIVRLREKLHKQLPHQVAFAKQMATVEAEFRNKWADQLEKNGRIREAEELRTQAGKLLTQP